MFKVWQNIISSTKVITLKQTKQKVSTVCYWINALEKKFEEFC